MVGTIRVIGFALPLLLLAPPAWSAGFADCLAPNDPQRWQEEKAELLRLQEEARRWIRETCRTHECAGNGEGAFKEYVLPAVRIALGDLYEPWGPKTDGEGRTVPQKPLMYGCAVFATELGIHLANSPTKYLDVRSEMRCAPGIIPPNRPRAGAAPSLFGGCHFVLVASNPRSGEQHVIDPWAVAGGWRLGGDDIEKGMKDGFYSYSEFVRRFPDIGPRAPENGEIGRCRPMDNKFDIANERGRTGGGRALDK